MYLGRLLDQVSVSALEKQASLGMVALKRWRQEDQKFKASLGYIEVILGYKRPCPKPQMNKCLSMLLFTLVL